MPTLGGALNKVAALSAKYGRSASAGGGAGKSKDDVPPVPKSDSESDLGLSMDEDIIADVSALKAAKGI